MALVFILPAALAARAETAPNPAAADQSPPLRIRYTLDDPALGEVLKDFGRGAHVAIDSAWADQAALKLTLLREADGGEPPDAVIVPADHLGLHQRLNLSPVDDTLVNAQLFDPKALATTVVDGRRYGIPVLLGNHLLLYYNRKLVTVPADEWDVLIDDKTHHDMGGRASIVWPFDIMYWFAPFLGPFGATPLVDGQVHLNTPQVASALKYYWRLSRHGVVDRRCDYRCGVERFTSGQAAYSINGSWARHTYEDALGPALGVAALPTIDGEPLRPYYTSFVLAFPGDGLMGPRHQQLTALARYLTAVPVQRRLWQTLRELPATASVQAEARNSTNTNDRTALAALDDALPLPSDAAMAYVWEAMGKGSLRFGNNVLSAEEAVALMQQLAEEALAQAPSSTTQAEP